MAPRRRFPVPIQRVDNGGAREKGVYVCLLCEKQRNPWRRTCKYEATRKHALREHGGSAHLIPSGEEHQVRQKNVWSASLLGEGGSRRLVVDGDTPLTPRHLDTYRQQQFGISSPPLVRPPSTPLMNSPCTVASMHSPPPVLVAPSCHPYASSASGNRRE